MTSPEHTVSTEQESTIVVYAWSWLAALKAAIQFTDKDHPTIRVNLDTDSEQVIVSALVPNHALAIEVPVQWIDVPPENYPRDRGFELTKKQVEDVLQVFKTKSYAGVELEDQPMYSVHLSAEKVRYSRADELDVKGLSPLEQFRNATDELPDNVADVVDPSASFPLDAMAQVSVDQINRIVKVASILKADISLQAMEIESDTQQAKTSILCGPATSMARIPKPVEPHNAEQSEAPSFDDEDHGADYDEPLFDMPSEDEPEATNVDVNEETPSLRIVGADPTSAT